MYSSQPSANTIPLVSFKDRNRGHSKVTPGSAPLQPHIVIGYDQAVLQSASKLIVVFH
jgi:hypothetical protein